MHRPEISVVHAVEVHRFVARRVANLADAADIAQQTLLLACVNLRTCRGKDLSAWLFTIARHLIVDHYRQQKRSQFVEGMAMAEMEPALQTPPDTALECRERLGGWLICLTYRLRPEEQVAVLLADVYGHRDKDSATLLCMSVPCFKLLLHGARSRLHEICGRNCMLLRKQGAPACDESSKGHGCKNTKRCCGGLPPERPTYRVGVASLHLGARKLLALRGKLLAGLNLL